MFNEEERKGNNWCKERQKWGEKRAMVIRKPENVIEGECG
jgi:hypothetical protein